MHLYKKMHYFLLNNKTFFFFLIYVIHRYLPYMKLRTVSKSFYIQLEHRSDSFRNSRAKQGISLFLTQKRKEE